MTVTEKVVVTLAVPKKGKHHATRATQGSTRVHQEQRGGARRSKRLLWEGIRGPGQAGTELANLDHFRGLWGIGLPLFVCHPALR